MRLVQTISGMPQRTGGPSLPLGYAFGAGNVPEFTPTNWTLTRIKTQTHLDGSVRRFLQIVESVHRAGRRRQSVVATLERVDELASGG
jgi:hypothetical protein